MAFESATNHSFSVKAYPSPPGHEIHDKFVVCDFNGNDPVVYCGSSNLASGGEAANGDNLLAIHDADVATAFAIEALGLVDHYNFLDRWAKPKAAGKKKGTTTNRAPSKKTPVKKAAANKKAVKKASFRRGRKASSSKKAAKKVSPKRRKGR
jgi:hypothetical protein